MKIKIIDEINENGLLGRLLLHCITYHTDAMVKDKMISNSQQDSFDGFYDVRLTIDDDEMNIQSFIERLEENIERAIEDEVAKRIDDNLYDEMKEIGDILVSFKSAVYESVKKSTNRLYRDVSVDVTKMTKPELYGLIKQCDTQIQDIEEGSR